MIVAVMIIAGLEVCKAVGNKFEKPLAVIVVVFCLVGYAVFLAVHLGFGSGGITAFLAVLALFAIAVLVIRVFSRQHTRRLFGTIFVLVYPVSILVYLLALNYLTDDVRVTAIALAFLISSFTDVMAFAVGSTLKGPKLMPSVSPKKTVSGAIGGLAGGVMAAMIVMALGYFEVLQMSPLDPRVGFNVLHFVIFGLAGAFCNQAGDLIASYIKRSCEIKDYGSVLPGHGGVMDRVDGLMVTAVFVYLYMAVLVMFM